MNVLISNIICIFAAEIRKIWTIIIVKYKPEQTFRD